MAGTLVIDTLKSGTSGPPAFQNTSGVAVGTLCRAWVSFVGSSTATIRASFNVSSITYNATGDYTVNFTNAMTDANYCALVASEGLTTWPSELRDSSFYPGSVATGSIRVRTGKTPTGYEDLNSGVFVAVFR